MIVGFGVGVGVIVGFGVGVGVIVGFGVGVSVGLIVGVGVGVIVGVGVGVNVGVGVVGNGVGNCGGMDGEACMLGIADNAIIAITNIDAINNGVILISSPFL